MAEWTDMRVEDESLLSASTLGEEIEGLYEDILNFECGHPMMMTTTELWLVSTESQQTQT